MLSCVIAERTKEIGVRIALGAAPAKIYTMVLRNVGWMTLIGGTAGLAAAIAGGKFSESLLFNLNGHDPVILGWSALLLFLGAFGAGFIPARRASRHRSAPGAPARIKRDRGLWVKSFIRTGLRSILGIRP